MSNELRPCPFCGGEAKAFFCEESGTYDVQCQQCGALPFLGRKRGPGRFKSMDDVIAAWNRRAERTVRPTLYDDFCGCVNVCCPTCGRTLSGPWSDVRDAVRSSKRRDVMGNYCPGCGARIEVCE